MSRKCIGKPHEPPLISGVIANRYARRSSFGREHPNVTKGSPSTQSRAAEENRGEATTCRLEAATMGRRWPQTAAEEGDRDLDRYHVDHGNNG